MCEFRLVQCGHCTGHLCSCCHDLEGVQAASQAGGALTQPATVKGVLAAEGGGKREGVGREGSGFVEE